MLFRRFLYWLFVVHRRHVVVICISDTTTVNVIYVSSVLCRVVLVFNVKKSNVVVIGKDDDLLLPDTTLSGSILSYFKEILIVTGYDTKW